MDIFEDEVEVHVELEVPGMRRDELNIRLDRDRLSIQGFKHSVGDSECLRYLCLEREFGIFRRIVEIPVSVDASGARAALVEGVLKIKLPKVTERRQTAVDVTIDD
ncbi:Hsp20/alpha crystallin family protein [bacterium]|nr:Hsp20/alpha crystallin family protein [bacterium]